MNRMTRPKISWPNPEVPIAKAQRRMPIPKTKNPRPTSRMMGEPTSTRSLSHMSSPSAVPVSPIACPTILGS